MLNFEHHFPVPLQIKGRFCHAEPNVKQEYRIAALVHSKLVADIVYRETLLLGWNISIEVTSYETGARKTHGACSKRDTKSCCATAGSVRPSSKNSDAARSSSSVRRSTSSKA